MAEWQPIDTAPEGVVVETRISDAGGERNVQRLERSGRLWFMPDASIHVFYTPTHWRPVENNDERLARYEQALQRLAVGAISPSETAHPLTAIGRIARRLLEGADIETALRELREDHAHR